jgi:hypothetical protein
MMSLYHLLFVLTALTISAIVVGETTMKAVDGERVTFRSKKRNKK